MKNPLYDIWKQYNFFGTLPKNMEEGREVALRSCLAGQARHLASVFYSFAVPDDHALNLISQYKPIIEIGAGTGYWALLLNQMGIEVKAFDCNPRSKDLTFYPVEVGTPEKCKEFPDYTLFICYPPLGEDCNEWIKHYSGEYVLFIQEGCTGQSSDLEDPKQWENIISYQLPNWYNCRETLEIYKRVK